MSKILEKVQSSREGLGLTSEDRCSGCQDYKALDKVKGHCKLYDRWVPADHVCINFMDTVLEKMWECAFHDARIITEMDLAEGVFLSKMTGHYCTVQGTNRRTHRRIRKRSLCRRCRQWRKKKDA